MTKPRLVKVRALIDVIYLCAILEQEGDLCHVA